MYLKEIILDGFKSYATRTVIPAFDPLFNAITGLNGSGKSNVLDSICFVLGISNLSQVRANSLQELVYKSGQAGISKASVTLVFDNTDKERGPVGYEKFGEISVMRQVVIGGRNKYLINGHVSQPSKVQNLFHSIGLNVNNPHFLIMQGRITKVINMKPLEIMGMVEEAAGTRMYENKKVVALRMIGRKERKVEEINELLEGKIRPSLERLRGERKGFLEWAGNKGEIERLGKFVVGFRYWKAGKVVRVSGGEMEGLEEVVRGLKGRLKRVEGERRRWEERVEVLLGEQDTEQSCRLSKLEGVVDKLEKDLVKEQSRWENQSKAVEGERKLLEEIEGKMKDAAVEVDQKKASLRNAEEKVAGAKATKENTGAELQAAETAMLTGAGSSQGTDGAASAGSLVEQLEAARRAASSAATDIRKYELELSHARNELEEKKYSLTKHRKEANDLKAKIKQSENAVSQAKIALHELDFNADENTRLSEYLAKETKAASQLKNQVDELGARLSRFDFSYADPEPGFDRSRVKGKVAKLIRIKSADMSTAIEVTAGGRLYQVVVDNEKTGKALLKKGRLPGRVTILPLNKIARKRLPNEKLRNAKRIESRTALAIDLIDFDAQVAAVMEYIFGSTLVSPDLESAKAITFDRNVMTRTVTTDGDIFDPSGTLSGGSSAKSSSHSVLAQLTKLGELEAALNTHIRNIEKLSKTLQGLERKAEQHRQLVATLEFKQHDLELLRKHLNDSPAGRLLNEVDELESRITKELPEAMRSAKEACEAADEKAKKLENSLEDEDSARDLAEADAQKAKDAIEKRNKAAIDALQNAFDAKEKVKAELEALEADIEKLQSDHARMKESVDMLKKEALDRETTVSNVREEYEKQKGKYEEQKRQLIECRKDLNEATRERDRLIEEYEQADLELRKADHKRKNLERDYEQSVTLRKQYDENYAWLAHEKEYFGLSGGDYDFELQSVEDAKKQLEKLKEVQEVLESKINKKAMAMFENAESEYQDLMNKKRIVEKDRAKIESVISELDEKKNDTLKNTWKKVNKSFGEIFSTLLPGTNAKLEPPEGGTLEDGLEIRVALGNVWKDSLSELSGGQRSLIALSFILAMLRFKPAPMYILDEVDAALDLSHTQNIGRMLRKHFKGSQFIVVSLKEGMFQNANIIFRTKFVDGISTITRTANRISYNSDGEEENSNVALQESGRRRPKGKTGASRESEKENAQNFQQSIGRKRRLRT